MAFDQSSVPKDLRPLNIVRNAAEDPRLAPLTSAGRPIEGFYTSPPADLGSSPGTMPTIYYPPMLPDAAFVQLGFSNSAVPGVGGGWVPHVVPLKQPPNTVNHPAGGSGNNQICWPRVPTSALDNNSEDDSASSHKIKFLCSFGGKLLPRLSDGALRYVGGQTRIISVRRNVSFSEFIGKMADTYAQGVSVKYQLPDEDLDALVSVSCPDDLNNMMDEYEKLVERCPDGSAKLRIFLFTPSDVECGGFAGVGDAQDCGQMYVEAVNGVLDGFSGNSCNNSRYARKERMESVVPVQNSLDLSGAEGGDGLLANHLGDFIGVPSSCGGNYANNNPVSCTKPSSAQTGISVGTGPGMSEREVERSVPVTVDTQPVSPYIQAYMNPQQESMNHASFVQIGNVLGPMRPAFAQPQPLIPAGVFPQPVVHMKMNPSLMSMNPHVLDPQQVRMEQLPLQRPVEITADLGYSALPTQVLGQGGAYNWHQVPHLVPRFEDCYMCQKALPHAHSDTITQEKNEVTTGIVSDMKSIYSSAQCDSRGQSVIRPVLPMMEDNVKQLASGSRSRIMGNTDNPEFGTNQEGITGVLQNIEVPCVSDKAIFQKAENPGALKATHQQDIMMTSGVQYTYGVLVANPPQSCQPNAVHNPIVPPKFQVNNDFSPIGVSLQTKDPVLHESPKSYAVKVSGGVPMDESSSLVTEPLRQIDEKLENLKLGPPVVLSNTEHNKLVVDPRKEDTHNITCAELYEMTDPSPVGNLNTYPYSNQGINHLRAGDTSGNTVYPGIDAPHTAERILPAGEWKDSNTAWSQSKVTGLGDATDNSISLFSNQDPWNIRPDKHFPPPKPTKIQIRKDIGPREETRLLNIGEAPRVLPLDSPLGDVGYQQSSYQDFDLDRSLSNKGSTEELIKQELQAVAEGVAASVFHSPVPSIPDLSLPVTQQNGDVQLNNVEIQQKDKLEEIKTNLTDKINFGFPASGMGRLQIIRNCDLEELQELGSGTFGTVYHGKWRGTDVAIKRINDRCFAGKPSEQERMRDDFWNEAIKLADLHHPNVVAFYGVVLDGPGGSIATVTEYMVNGSLRNAFQKSERNLDKRKRLLIGMDVAFGMEYLHGKNIVHFDLKSDNLLVNLRDPHRPICKVSDLGLSKVKCQTLISGGVRGTLPWMAPELLNGSSSLVSEKVDVFSFGIVMWELLTGEEPYADLHYGAIIGGIVSNTLRPVVPEGCDADWRALMERCWSSEPSVRPNFTDIANELRAMSTKLPSKQHQQQHQPPLNNPHIKG